MDEFLKTDLNKAIKGAFKVFETYEAMKRLGERENVLQEGSHQEVRLVVPDEPQGIERIQEYLRSQNLGNNTISLKYADTQHPLIIAHIDCDSEQMLPEYRAMLNYKWDLQ